VASAVRVESAASGACSSAVERLTEISVLRNGRYALFPQTARCVRDSKHVCEIKFSTRSMIDGSSGRKTPSTFYFG